MIDTRHLEKMYQQWQQGNEDYAKRWVDFIDLVHRQTGKSHLELANALQRTRWFQWDREE